MENNGFENICKVIILESSQRRLFHPMLHEDIQERITRCHKRPTAIKKCLFGRADPDDTKRMLEEQYQMDQRRFFTKFGFDIETIEHLERSKDDARENIENDRNGQNRSKTTTTTTTTTSCNVLGGNVKSFGRKILKARRKVSFSNAQANQSQQFITDFYQTRKSTAHPPLEKKSTQPKATKSSPIENC